MDAKASFALTIESAVVAGVITLSGNGHPLGSLHNWWTLTLYWLGLAALVVGVILAAEVVRRQAASPAIGH